DRHPDSNGEIIEGPANFKQLAGYEKITNVPRSITGRDGRHLIYLAPPEALNGEIVFKDKMCPGVDIKFRGYIVAPPSIHPNGKQYRWAEGASLFECEPPPLPDWMLQHMIKRSTSAFAKNRNSNGIERDDEETRQRFIDYLSNTAPRAVSGHGGNNTTFNVACVGHDFGLSEEVTYELMLEHYNTEKCSPPWSEDELRKTVANGHKYPKGAQGNEHPDFVFAGIEIPSTSDNWTECKPLQRDLPAPDTFPLEALGDDLAPVVNRVAEVIQAPPAICAMSFLAAVNLAVQAHADIENDGRVSPISSYFLSIAESGERKSAVDSEALYAHREWQRQNWSNYELETFYYEQALELYEATKRQILGDKNKLFEHKQSEIAKLQKPRAPISPIRLAGEPTLEGLEKQLDSGFPSLGLFNSEGGQFIGGFAMSKDNQLKTAAGLSSLWDNGEFNRMRAGDGSKVSYGKRLAMHLMLQPGVSNQLLSNSQLKDQGFLSRCLVVRPEFVRKQYVDVDLSQDHLVKAYRHRIGKILDHPLPLAEGSRNVLKPRRLTLDSKAKAAYQRFHNEVQNKVGPGESLANIRGFANKAHDHAARLAATLALFADLKTPSVNEEHMDNAIKLVRHVMGELLRLIDVGAVDPALAEAQQLLDWLRARQATIISLVEIYKTGPNSIRSARKARSVMQTLRVHGYVRPANPVEYLGILRNDAWEVR
ncbi:MAG: DUF3987 domain-containing protein, partial [Candidatus Obscuribacterales bacterium]|nr:DUF3987 domain-containing protein [Candidatus Obscuribacterales bacterium]